MSGHNAGTTYPGESDGSMEAIASGADLELVGVSPKFDRAVRLFSGVVDVSPAKTTEPGYQFGIRSDGSFGVLDKSKDLVRIAFPESTPRSKQKTMLRTSSMPIDEPFASPSIAGSIALE